MSLTLGADGTPQRKRRVRYKGKNPRRFDEKYKELNPEKYADDIEKIAVIAGGGVGPFSCRALAEFSPAQPDE